MGSKVAIRHWFSVQPSLVPVRRRSAAPALPARQSGPAPRRVLYSVRARLYLTRQRSKDPLQTYLLFVIVKTPISTRTSYLLTVVESFFKRDTDLWKWMRSRDDLLKKCSNLNLNGEDLKLKLAWNEIEVFIFL